STLSKSALNDSAADHMGESGFFLYECSTEGIEVLAKVTSFEAALRLLDLLDAGMKRAVRIAERTQARAARRLAA
ncbi:MAG TPA: hypothetical protein VHM92_07160, partial [Allosphingosinicella sp.]|nr:hypothetical protein [Allosphingosinicella sp.]